MLPAETKAVQRQPKPKAVRYHQLCMISHIIIHIRAISTLQTSGNFSDTKDVLNIPNKDILYGVQFETN
jgi:hypothetical protein